jgi:hypothetical protein
MVKHCCHGLCKSDTKIDPSRKFLPFPKPKRQPEKLAAGLNCVAEKILQLQILQSGRTFVTSTSLVVSIWIIM